MTEGFIRFDYWFLFVAIICVMLIILYIFSARKNLQLKKKIADQKSELDKLSEVDHIKSRFFANLSHEFRTMLTLISGPLDLIRNHINHEVIRQNLPLRPYEQIRNTLSQEASKKNLKIIQNNAKMLNRLVNQLLDLSKLDTGKLAIKTKPVEVISVLKHIVISFTPYAENKNITITFQSDHETLFTYLDSDKFEIIINNLLSNAVKFTPHGGELALSVTRKDGGLSIDKQTFNCVEIKICDSGKGIPEDKLSKIFERFYQVSPEENRTEGSGIGLSLTKELVELHHGRISVISKINIGTTFILQFPLGKDHLKEDEIVSDFVSMDGLTVSQMEEARERQKIQNRNNELPLALIVEDNDDMRYFIRNSLISDFYVEEAINGIDALNVVKDKVPDIIISDIMMPEMDGISFCKKLKEKAWSDHIPIVFLTARADEKDKVEGLDLGAYDYIVKPFSSHELLTRLKNIIHQRKKMHDRIQHELLLEPEKNEVISIDNIFINNARKIVENNLSDYEFTVEKFADEIALSRFHLNRKLQNLTGLTPSRFIREIRLKKAVHLLENHKDNISQIALEVGFDNFAYFNRCFKDKYGSSPSRYISSLKNR